MSYRPDPPQWTATHQAVAAAVAAAIKIPGPRMPSGPVDWSAFLPLVKYHQVGALVHRSDLLPALGAPETILAQVAADARRTALRALHQFAFLDELIRALRAEEIAVVVLKGLPLAEQAYGDPAVRAVGDIDLMVEPARVIDALEVCARLGLAPTPWPHDPDGDQLRQALTVAGRLPALHEVHLVGEITVDLHWRLFANSRLQPLDPSWLWLPSTVRVGAALLPVLPLDQVWSFLAVHGVKHSWQRLKWLADIPALLGRHPELTRPTDPGHDRCVATALRLSERLLGPFLDDEHRSWAAGVTGTARPEQDALARLVEPDVRPLTPRSLPRYVSGRMALRDSSDYRQEEGRFLLLQAGRSMLIPNPSAFTVVAGPAKWATREVRQVLGARTATVVRPTVGAVRTVVRIVRVPSGRRRLLLEAAVELTHASVRLGLAPPHRILRLLGDCPVGTSTSTEAPAAPAGSAGVAIEIGRAVTRMARLLPWHPSCLRQALATSRMLQRRDIPGQVELGVADPSALSAHAWVVVGDQVVVGARQRDGFVPLATFTPRLRKGVQR